MPSIHHLAPEILTQVLQRLPIESQIIALRVCKLWSTILTSQSCRKARYAILQDTDPSSPPSSPSSPQLRIHKILYDSDAALDVAIWSGLAAMSTGISLTGAIDFSADGKLSESLKGVEIWPAYKPVAPNILSSPNTTDTNDINSQSASSSGCFPRSVKIALLHPLLSEPLFLLRGKHSLSKIYCSYNISHSILKAGSFFTRTTTSSGFLQLTLDTPIRDVLTDVLDEIERLTMSTRRYLAIYKYHVRFFMLPRPTRGKDEYPGVDLKVHVKSS
ncbi:hypothetical protein TWF718_010778 [Orbilia javanica]|uniref:F-box domain-containing protein n=1 Tax=Orbilia javanica TaxID=47235 RepID=A0AAN8MJW8_9PEZI